MDTALQNEIESLRPLKTRQLQARFEELFGEKSPSSNRAHLFRRIAYAQDVNSLQAQTPLSTMASLARNHATLRTAR